MVEQPRSPAADVMTAWCFPVTTTGSGSTARAAPGDARARCARRASPAPWARRGGTRPPRRAGSLWALRGPASRSDPRASAWACPVSSVPSTSVRPSGKRVNLQPPRSGRGAPRGGPRSRSPGGSRRGRRRQPAARLRGAPHVFRPRETASVTSAPSRKVNSRPPQQGQPGSRGTARRRAVPFQASSSTRPGSTGSRPRGSAARAPLPWTRRRPPPGR